MKEVVVACVQVLFRHLIGTTEENHVPLEISRLWTKIWIQELKVQKRVS